MRIYLIKYKVILCISGNFPMSFTVELFRIVTDEFYPRTLLPKILLCATVEIYRRMLGWTLPKILLYAIVECYRRMLGWTLPKILLYAIVELYLGFYRWTMLIGDSQIQARIYIGQLFKEYE